MAQALLERGPSTAPELAEALGLTVQAVRRHLDSLLADGAIAAGDEPPYGPRLARGRGRPPKIYSLTEAGRDAFDPGYDEIAVDALRYVRDITGDAGVRGFAARRADRLSRRLAGVDESDEPAQELVDRLNMEGYAASLVGRSPGIVQICQHNCPVAHVASEFPEICDAETEVLGRALGSHVTRLATIAHGDGVCTTLVHDPGVPDPTGVPTQSPATSQEAPA